jgi:hypothetical protein
VKTAGHYCDLSIFLMAPPRTLTDAEYLSLLNLLGETKGEQTSTIYQSFVAQLRKDRGQSAFVPDWEAVRQFHRNCTKRGLSVLKGGQ